MSRLAAPIYLGAVALMVLLLLIAWVAPGPLADWRHWHAPPPQTPKLDDVQASMLHANPLAVGAYPVILERPLFNVSRQPAASAPAAGASAPPPSAIEQATLQGIVAGPTLTGVMLQEGGQPRFLHIGERLGDWVLASVQDRAAVFERGGQQHRIALDPAPGEAPAASSPAAAPRQATGPSPAPAARVSPLNKAPRGPSCG